MKDRPQIGPLHNRFTTATFPFIPCHIPGGLLSTPRNNRNETARQTFGKDTLRKKCRKILANTPKNIGGFHPRPNRTTLIKTDTGRNHMLNIDTILMEHTNGNINEIPAFLTAAEKQIHTLTLAGTDNVLIQFFHGLSTHNPAFNEFQYLF